MTALTENSQECACEARNRRLEGKPLPSASGVRAVDVAEGEVTSIDRVRVG